MPYKDLERKKEWERLHRPQRLADAIRMYQYKSMARAVRAPNIIPTRSSAS